VKNALLLTLSLALSLLVGEAMLRVAGYAPNPFATRADTGWSVPDPELGWKNGSGTFASSEAGNAAMNFGPDGRRRARPDAAPRAPRVDLLGDSITQGYGVTDPETYAWRLGESMPGPEFENLGVGGYGTYQSLLVMERRLSPPPALFVYGFFGDHQYRNVAHLTWVRALRDAAGRNIVPPHVTVEDGRLVRHPGRTEAAWPLEARSAIVTELHRAWMRFVFRGRRDQTRPALERLLAEMDATAKAAGARFLVLLLADAPDWLVPYLAARRIAVADCREPEFERDPSLRVGGTGHPTGARHALWAACLAPAVETALRQ
jgi:hypothetical protein